MIDDKIPVGQPVEHQEILALAFTNSLVVEPRYPFLLISVSEETGQIVI